MITLSFDASVDLSFEGRGLEFEAVLLVAGKKIQARFLPYPGPAAGGRAFVRVLPGRAVDVVWNDPVFFETKDGGIRGQGAVLHPAPGEAKKPGPAKRTELLERLARGEKEMLLALAEERGGHGLRLEEIERFSGLGPARIESLARKLEEEDKVRILSFSPLFLVSQSALEFLRERITALLARFHEKRPDKRGIEMERIVKRFGPPPKILSLVIRGLEKEGRVRQEGEILCLADFKIPITPEDEAVLERLEDMLFRGEFEALSLEDVRRALRLSEEKLQILLSVLTERKKVVKGRDGFILHSRWLDDLVKTIRESGKRELSVADFKALTGLSRKYAIPLLELLDEMGVTRRKGSVRDIL